MKKKNLTIQEIFSVALKNHHKNNFIAAENLYKKILKKTPDHIDSIFLLGSLSLQIKNFDRAKKYLNKTIEIQNNHVQAHYNLGNMFKELGEHEKAINSYERAIQIKPNFTAPYINLGLIFQELENYEKAINSYRKAIQIQPNSAPAYNNLGLAFQELGEIEKAIESYQQAIQIQPNYLDFHNNLGIAFQKLGEIEKAIQSYQRAIKIQPSSAPAHYNLGNTFKELGEHEKAINSYEQAVKYAPENLSTYYSLSDLKKKIVDINLKKKIRNILKNKNSTKMNIAYGNFLLARYEFQSSNYEKEFDYLLKGHRYYFESSKKNFTEQVKYMLSELPNAKKIFALTKPINNTKKSDYTIKPIFIIGVPRCGSTLIEKIIASGKMRIPTGEETEVINSIIKWKMKKNPLLNLDIEDLKKKIIAKYKNAGLIDKKNNYTFTDKSLENFFHLRLIKTIFPHAKVINCKRNALSSIVSILKNNLTGTAWAHNVEHIFKYFDIYYEMIEKFKKNFPDFIYDLEFEKFVNGPQMESKKLFKFCNLIWDEKCLEFYKRKDLVSRTASNIQIRKPLYKDSIKKYLPYKKLLNSYGDQYRWFNI